MVSKKIKRHSGWETSRCTLKENKQFIIDNCLEPSLNYDGWAYSNSRTIMHDGKNISKYPLVWLMNCDCKSCRKKIKTIIKQKKLLKIRKARKF